MSPPKKTWTNTERETNRLPPPGLEIVDDANRLLLPPPGLGIVDDVASTASSDILTTGGHALNLDVGLSTIVHSGDLLTYSALSTLAPSPSPIQKQSASRLSSTAPMNQGPSPGSPVVKDKLASYITQKTVGTQTGRQASPDPDGRPLPP